MIFQISTNLLNACVLSILSKEDTYRYAITQVIKNLLNVSKSTIYPVLRRLEKDKYLSTYDKPFQGRNRRYYHITESSIK